MSGTTMSLKAVLAAVLSVSALLPATAQTPDFQNLPALPGNWTYQAFPGGSRAAFTDSSGALRLSLRCVAATRQLVLSRTTATPASTMFVWTSSEQRSLGAQYDPGNAQLATAFTAADSMLDSIAFSRGRFVVSVPGALPLAVVPAPEAARAIEDCRN